METGSLGNTTRNVLPPWLVSLRPTLPQALRDASDATASAANAMRNFATLIGPSLDTDWFE
jgi:hypothetical protein